MKELKNYYRETNHQEAKKIISSVERIKINAKPQRKTDVDYLCRVLLTWVVGGLVSLMPTLTQIYIESYYDEGIRFIEDLFCSKDLFLVITTLIISVLFELIFNNKSGIPKYIVISLGIMMTVFSIYIYSLLQTDVEIPNIILIGEIDLALCMIISTFGYTLSSKKGGEKING